MAWKAYPLLGFAPDLPNDTPGVLVSTGGAVPTDKGIGNPPALVITSSAMNGASFGGALLTKTDGTQRVFIGTASKLYETTTAATGLNDVSDTAYSATATNSWAFTQFGDVSLAVNLGNIMRYSSSGSFAAVGVAPVPKAACITTGGPTSAPFVMVGDYNDGTNAYRDGWYCSALGDYTDWTPDVATQCANGRLIDDIPGPITAMIGFRDDIVAFKGTGMYVGSYVGTPTIWSWRRISSDIGCIGKNSVVRANDVLYFADSAGIWMFDGSYPRMVPGSVQRYWALKAAARMAASTNPSFRLMWDKPKHLLWVLTNAGGQVQEGLMWNAISGIWTQYRTGYMTALTDPIMELITPRIATFVSNKLGTLTWDSVTSDGLMVCDIFGWMVNDRVSTTTLKGLRPHYTSVDTSVSASASFLSFTSQSDYTTETQSFVGSATLVARSPGRFDGQLSAPIISWSIRYGPKFLFEITGVSIDSEPAGQS